MLNFEGGMLSRPGLPILIAFAFVLFPARLQAADTLPYASRTRGYTGLATTVTGDLRTIGMAGSPSAISDSVVSASQDNPAALSMSLGGAGLQLMSVETADGQVQNMSAPVSRGSFGLGAAVYPWGFSVSQQTQRAEGQPYEVGAGGPAIEPDLRLLEYRLSVSRVFWDDALAIGVSGIVGRAIEDLNDDEGREDLGLSWSVGAIYQFPRRWFFGVSYTPGETYEFDAAPSSAVANFYQPMKMPWRFNLGTGWVPNRFFKFSTALVFIGPESGSALLRDQNVAVGERMTLQPRLGASYRWIDMRAIRGRLNVGTYYETSRATDGASRLHFTGSVEVEPWIFSFGWGFDLAPEYRNTVFSGTVDLGQLAEILRIVPRPRRPLVGGVLPNPYFLSDEGLARPMVRHWVEEEENPDILEVGRELPSKLRNRIENPDSSLEAIGKDLVETLETVPTDVKASSRKKPGAPKKTAPTASQPSPGQTKKTTPRTQTPPKKKAAKKKSQRPATGP